MTRYLVCGGRDFSDQAALDFALTDLIPNPETATIIQGGARGADRMAALWGFQHGCAVENYPPDWAEHGKAAGIIRNRTMLIEGKPDIVIAFPGGRGTQDMITQAHARGFKVVEVSA